MALEVKAGKFYKTGGGDLVEIVSTNEGRKSTLFQFAIGWKINTQTGERSAYTCSREGYVDLQQESWDDLIELSIGEIEIETHAVVATGRGKYPRGFILNITDDPENAENSFFFKENPGHWAVVKLTGKKG